ncbi:type VI secretion system protein TssL, short form [Pseudomonas guariconensis]|uniref:type VI secretion system protein TssL, short form n=1 Tax=Pseudomonas TaxID=286 RepID=UPI0020982E3F|nr:MULTISPECIES: type VI secretion system protein TssL, short form [Pseudomonas]MCO7639350.1 type VI secretion system protein TssL, short form [Pseudomonas sp. S 311-6]MCO7515184.1 type VI secretion system protein TssL, short form [Pseudomonas putida]MCO7565054.1 type VI secretion system protein TssL, short form [Pseudomonas mosselii]MCO7605061.1 type VI secretion system protein TssL, short form [Pseudomonas guariconensis]MCO7616347.1 type VI secretion system protein TssL, short form [Pseudomo
MTKVFGKPPAVDIDALLQDCYLTVVELQQKALPKDGEALWAHCVAQVEQCRNRLIDAGVSQRAVNRICYAQCALLDEAVLRKASAQTHAVWAAKPLQAHFFSRHQAGEQLYEDMHEALAEPAPDLRVLTCYHRVLMLGFLGRYREENAAQREQLLAALGEHVEPFAAAGATPALVSAGGGNWRRWLSMPWLHVAAAAVLLVGLWWGLHRVLGDTVTSLLQGQV